MKKENSISRRDFVKTSVAGTTYIAGASLLNGCETTNTSPNVLFIITDQQHIDTISAGGCSHVETPAMDRLYRRSVSFQKSYSTNPVSSPARSSIAAAIPKPTHISLFEKNFGLPLSSSGSRMMG